MHNAQEPPDAPAMLIDFFYTLRAAKLPVSVKEYLTLLEALKKGVVGPNTHPLQNTNAFEFFDGFIQAKEALLETAGSLDEGRKVWVMAKIQRPNSEIVKGDEVAKFVLLSNSHDGTTAVRVGFTPIRVVCANTLAMAHSDKASKLIRVRHSKQVKQNLDAIRETMNVADEEFEATAEQFRFLASRQINAKDLEKYIKVALKMDEGEKLSTRSSNILTEIVRKHEDRTGMLAQAKLRAMDDMKSKESNLLSVVTEHFEAGRGTDNVPVIVSPALLTLVDKSSAAVPAEVTWPLLLTVTTGICEADP